LALAPGAFASPPTGYTLAFSDEFNGSGLDTSAWGYRTDGKANSQQLAANVSVSGGYLHLAVKKQVSGTYGYTGGGVISKAGFAEGYYEARFKVPAGAGWHSSFWSMGYNGVDTGLGANMQEVDFCEQDSANLTHYTTNYHKWSPSPQAHNIGTHTVTASDLSANFHTIAALFTPSTVTYYLDGVETSTTDISAYPDHNSANIWLTTLAYGAALPDDTKLPSEMLVDWVHYYAPPAIIMDNADSTGVTKVGNWSSSTFNTGYYGVDYLQDGNTGGVGGKYVQFVPTITKTKNYAVYARWPSAANRATNASIDIVDSLGTPHTFKVDQTANNNFWMRLGTTYQFNAGTTGLVRIRNDGANGFVIADAIKLVEGDIPSIIKDDADSSGVTITGSWTSSSSTTGFYGSGYLQDNNTGATGGKCVRFTPTMPQAGNYDVYARWTSGMNRASNTPIDIFDSNGVLHTVAVNQQINGGGWVLLGKFYFSAGTSAYVQIRNDGANGYVIADAIRCVLP
jgi:beta-glucanase (GH16 family)